MFALRRYHRSLLFVLLLVGALASYSHWVAPNMDGWLVDRSRDAGFVLDDLKIEGMERSRQVDVLAALDVDNGMPLLSIDLAEMQRRLEMLPWIKRAEVTRLLPGQLVVRLFERQAFALWQEDGQVNLIDPDGVIITNEKLNEFAHLMRVVGKGAQTGVRGLQAMLEETPELAAQVRTAVRVGERRWDLIFDNGIRLKLPEDVQTPYGGRDGWERFVKLEAEHRLLAREIMVIDLRLRDRMVLRVTPEGRRRMDGQEWAT